MNESVTDTTPELRDLRQLPIVIGGCGRSGTTLMVSLLSAHPAIHVISDQGFNIETCWLSRKHPPNVLSRLARMINGIDPAFTHWCEKTPRNVHHLEWLLNYFGTSLRFVNVVRDGRDVVTSRHPIAPDYYWVNPVRWVRDVSAGRRFESDQRVLTIRYEDLVADWRRVMDYLCRWIGLPYHRNLDHYPATAKVQHSNAWFTSASRPTIRSVGRWRCKEHDKQVAKLLATDGAQELLEHYGYLERNVTTNWSTPRVNRWRDGC